MNHATLFVEIFPIRPKSIPPLIAYKVDISAGDLATIGGKLSYRLRRKFGKHWVWTAGHILTDAPQSQDEINRFVENLWQEDPTTYRSLISLKPDETWSISTQAQADFVARGLLEDLRPRIQQVLRAKSISSGKVQIERIYETRGWVVENQPAVSISVSSHLIYRDDLWTYARPLSDKKDLEELWVADKTSPTTKGVIVGISGFVSEHRKRLLAITQREEMQEIIKNASDDELVIRVSAGRNEYEYVASALRIIVRTEHFKRFGVNAQEVLKVLRMEPRNRAQLIKEISAIVKESGLIEDAYNTQNTPERFAVSSAIGFDPYLRFGGNQERKYDEKNILQYLRECGLYRRSNDSNIKIGVVSALNNLDTAEFEKRLIQELKQLRFKTEIVGREVIGMETRADFEMAIERLNATGPHILLAFFPDKIVEDDDEMDSYHHFKSLTIGQGIPSQVVYASTINNPYALANIILGIVGKTGSIPFVLANRMEYADLIVGIDIARRRKERLAGSINATAVARIYFSDGQFLRYVIHDAPLEGETIPESTLQSLFPSREFSGKRVVIHRDGYFRGGEKQALRNWAHKIGAEFFFVEVIKTGAPRLYAISSQRILQPHKGSMFKISETEALLVSSLPPFTNATPQPLHIRTELPFTIEKAAHSILCLTLLHYGSLHPPRLPVTIHYSDKIAYLVLRGIKPKNLEGDIPFWL
jgi:hypothetical protein